MCIRDSCAGVNTRAPHGLEEGNIFLSSFTLPHDTNTTTPAIPTYESALSDWKEVCEKRAARDKSKYYTVRGGYLTGSARGCGAQLENGGGREAAAALVEQQVEVVALDKDRVVVETAMRALT